MVSERIAPANVSSFAAGLDGDITQWIIRALRWFSFTLTEADEGITMNFSNCSESLWIGPFLLSSKITFLSWDGFSVT